MVEQVNVNVKNLLSEEIEVYRELVDGTREMEITIAAHDDRTIFIPEPGVFLIITPPNKYYTENCWFEVVSNNHLVTWDIIDDHWKVQLTDNEDEPEVPVEVNIEIGGARLPQ